MSSKSPVLKTRVVGIAIFLTALAVFYASPNLQVYDSNFSMLLSEVILRGHSVDLSRVPLKVLNFDSRNLRDGYPYQTIVEKGRRLYYMPWGGSILALPAVAVFNAVGVSALTPAWHFDAAGECTIQKILAAVLMAIFCWLVFQTAVVAELPVWWAGAIALGTAFGTQVWSTASRALWGQTWLLLLLGIALWLLLRWRTQRGRFHPIAFATLVSWMYFVRPMASVPIMAISAYLLFTYPRQFPAYLLCGLLWLGGFIATSMYFFGAPLPPYYHETWWLSTVGARHRLMAVLFSPSRGLFIYVPILGFVLFLTFRYWRQLRAEKLVLMSLAVIAADLAILSTLTMWWGGWSYGPRELTETVPFFVLLAIFGCRAFLADASLSLHGCSAIISFGIVLLILSVLINAPGALSYAAVGSWNVQEDQQHRELLWDWSHAPFLAPLSAAVTDAASDDADIPAAVGAMARKNDEQAAANIVTEAGPVVESVNGVNVIRNYAGPGTDWAPVLIMARRSNPLAAWWNSDLDETVIIRGHGFDARHGVAVGVFCPCRGSGQIGPFFFNPDNPNFSPTRIILQIPRPVGQPVPVGSGFIEVRNRGKDGTYSQIANRVWISLGAPLRVRHVYQSGASILVEGSGFESSTRINLYNSSSPFSQAQLPPNLGGVDGAGRPRILLNIESHSRFTFRVPDNAGPGEWYVEALNPPYLPFSSSYGDPGGAFVIR